MLAYEVSKAALNRLTISLARSNAKYGIRANAILPGSVDTPLLTTVSELEGERNGRTPQEQR